MGRSRQGTVEYRIAEYGDAVVSAAVYESVPADRRRVVLPTVCPAFARISAVRPSPHFAAVEPYGDDYFHGAGLSGPSTFFGATTWASAFAMTQGRSAVFGELCRAADGSPRVGKSGGHLQPFEDSLALYRLTGDKHWLEQAIAGGDRYIAGNLKKLPTVDLGVMPFVNSSFVPDWEGLLHLYEATGEQRFLDASVEGARWLLTTLWVHPMVKEGSAPFIRVTHSMANGISGTSATSCTDWASTTRRLDSGGPFLRRTYPSRRFRHGKSVM